ncbi:hypothetical protein Tco_0496396 [Tanacetum coccineum]
MLVRKAERENGAGNRIKNEPIKRDKKEEGVEAPSSQLVEYYLKYKINEKLIDGGQGVPRNHWGPVYEAILKKKVTRKEDIRRNFEIPEVEPLDETPLEDSGLYTCNHDIPLGSRENSVFDEPEPQPHPSFPSLEVDLGKEKTQNHPSNHLVIFDEKKLGSS